MAEEKKRKIQFPLNGSRVPFQKIPKPPDHIRSDFEILKRLLQMRDPLPETLDAVIVCGSDLLHVADGAARLCKQYAAKRQQPLFIVTGGRGKLTPQHWSSEAEVFGARMTTRGVPPSQMLLETKSETTTSNFCNSKAQLGSLYQEGRVNVLMVTADDVMLKRAILTAQKVFPNSHIVGFSPGHFTFDRAPGKTSAAAWRQRLLWTQVNELGRLVKYQKEKTADFNPITVSTAELRAATRIGGFLMEDASIPRDAKDHLQFWISALHSALDLS